MLARKKFDLIHNHPCFLQLSSEEVQKLSEILVEQKIRAGTVLVEENKIVDSIYFIAQGLAEIRKTEITNHGTKELPLAIVNAGEAIGLSESGFFSSSGARTASVIALTDMVVLRLDLAAFYAFLKKHPHINEEMHDATKMMLRMNLIKRVIPFTKFSAKDIQWLALQLKEITVPAGKLLFNKGDHGEICYLIESGKVEIFIPHANGTETQLAILNKKKIFGEASLLMNMPRNASARTLRESKLLILDYATLSQVIKSESSISKALMKLLKSRYRPMQLRHIESYETKTDDQEIVITLKNLKQANYYRLSQEGWFIWSLLDGKHTLRAITLAFYKKYDIFDLDLISNFILELEQNGFVDNFSHIHKQNQPQWPFWMKIIDTIRYYMEWSINFGNADKWITKTYQSGIFIFYNYFTHIIFTIIIVLGIGCFVAQFHHVRELLHYSNFSYWFLMIVPIAMASTILHELSHAYTTKAFGREVKHFGIGWFWFGPIAFCDTSDMWLTNRWARLAVDLAGIYMDLMLASIASLVAFFIQDPLIISILWLFALSLYCNVFYNLSPNIELDGYYTLMDLLNTENLRESAINWLVIKHNKFSKAYKNEMIYWVISITYIILEMGLTYIIINLLLYGVLRYQNIYLNLFLSLLIIVLSSLSIWSEIQKKKYAANALTKINF